MSGPDGAAPTARSAQKVRAKDIDAAFARSFAEKGYRATSVEAVSRELGIPKGSIFYHIGTKQEVFFRVQMEGMREFTDSLRSIAESEEPAPERLRLAIRDSVLRVDLTNGPLFGLTRDNHFLDPKHVQELTAVRDEYQQLFTQIIRDGIESKVFESPPHLNVVIFGLLRFVGLVRDWYRPDGALQLDEIADDYWAFICKGFGYDVSGHPR